MYITLRDHSLITPYLQRVLQARKRLKKQRKQNHKLFTYTCATVAQPIPKNFTGQTGIEAHGGICPALRKQGFFYFYLIISLKVILPTQNFECAPGGFAKKYRIFRLQSPMHSKKPRRFVRTSQHAQNTLTTYIKPLHHNAPTPLRNFHVNTKVS